MATIRSYTTIEQSRKLVEFLPIESADMKILPFTEREYRIVPINDIAVCDREDEIYTWSFAALMKIIEIDKCEICFDCYSEKYRVNVHYQTLGSFCQDNELYESKIDALFAMIIKLHKRNLL